MIQNQDHTKWVHYNQLKPLKSIQKQPTKTPERKAVTFDVLPQKVSPYNLRPRK